MVGEKWLRRDIPSSETGVYGRMTGFCISGPLYLVMRAASSGSACSLCTPFVVHLTGDVETGDGVLLWQVEAQFLGVVVELLGRHEDQADEALVTTGEALDRPVASSLWNVGLFLIRWRGVGAGTTTVHVVPTTNTGSGGDTTVDGAVVAGLSGLGGISTEVLSIISQWLETSRW